MREAGPQELNRKIARAVTRPRTGLPAFDLNLEGLLGQLSQTLAQAFPSWFPALSVFGALGLLAVALGFDRSRSGTEGGELLFWGGLLLLVTPSAVRLAMPRPSRSERIALIVFLGIGLYLVKVMQNPLAFAYPDEYIHAFNVNEILNSHALFSPDPLLPITPFYPGLATVTASVAAMTGLSSFQAGLLVIGVARCILVLALFFLFEEVSGSAQVAGLGALAYMANANFLFFSVEFAYESLALPLAVLLLYVVVSRLKSRDEAIRVGLGLAAVLLVATVVVTHHITSYAVFGLLLALSVAYRFLFRGRVRGPTWLAVFALVCSLAWLLIVANATLGYLYPVFLGAVKAFAGFFAGEDTSRALFAAAGSGLVAPIWERVIGISAVLIIVLALPFGLWRIWREHQVNPPALLLGAAAVGYLATLGFRFFPAAWEIGNRASEFLFVGVAFVLALAATRTFARRKLRIAMPFLVAALFAVTFVGGIIAGWPPQARMAQPYYVAAQNMRLNPEGITASIWTTEFLGPNNRIAADPSNAHALLADGHQFPLTGNSYGIRGMLYGDHIDQSVISILKYTEVRYVLVDRRVKSWDQMVGLFFDRAGQDTGPAFLPPAVVNKFDAPASVNRIYDSGNIVIYDVGVLDGLAGSH